MNDLDLIEDKTRANEECNWGSCKNGDTYLYQVGYNQIVLCEECATQFKECGVNLTDIKDYSVFNLARKEKYRIGTIIKFTRKKYEITGFDSKYDNMPIYKRLGITLEKAPSGRKLKSYAKFGYGSTMDMECEIITY
jgi:hypothetical protein